MAFHSGDHFVRGVVAGAGTGKSVMMIRATASWVAQDPGVDGVRRTRFGLVRATYPSLRTATVKTFSQWIPPLLSPVRQTAPMTAFFRGGLPAVQFDVEFIFIALKMRQTRKLSQWSSRYS